MKTWHLLAEKYLIILNCLKYKAHTSSKLLFTIPRFINIIYFCNKSWQTRIRYWPEKFKDIIYGVQLWNYFLFEVLLNIWQKVSEIYFSDDCHVENLNEWLQSKWRNDKLKSEIVIGRHYQIESWSLEEI